MAGKQLFNNFAKGTLAGNINAGDTSIALNAGQGALFPAPSGGDWFVVVLVDNSGNKEVVKVTARAGDTLSTCVRGQEGTTARNYSTNDKCENRWTQGSIATHQQRTDIQRNVAKYAGVAGGTSDALTATLASDLTAPQDGMKVNVEAAFANLLTNPTFNLTLGVTATGGVTIKKLGGVPLAAGDIAGAGHRLEFEYRTASNVWLLLNPAGIISRAIVSVRNAIQAAKQDTSGRNTALAAGTGLALDLSATATAFAIAFSAGVDLSGNVDLISVLNADQASAISGLAPSNTSYGYATWASLNSVTYGKTLVPPQDGYTYDRTYCSILNMEGGNGSTTFNDDGGNSWSPGGTAAITTSQFKFGTSSVDLTGGASKYVTSASFTTLGDTSWQMEVWFRINALPGVGANALLIQAVNAGNFGAYFYLNNTAGTIKLALNLSSNGTSNNIANATLGANTTWTLNQWNKVRFVFDNLAGTYKAYLSLNGAAETADISVSSALKIVGITSITLGRDVPGATSQFDGWMDAFRFIRAALNTSAETPAAAAPTVTDQSINFFSIPQMTAYEVTGQAPGAAQDPVMTQRYRVFVVEADTGAGAVSAVRNYAVRGTYESALTTISNQVTVNYAANIGSVHVEWDMWIVNVVPDRGYTVGDRVRLDVMGDAASGATLGYIDDRNNIKFGVTNAPVIDTPYSAFASIVFADWKYQLCARRSY